MLIKKVYKFVLKKKTKIKDMAVFIGGPAPSFIITIEDFESDEMDLKRLSLMDPRYVSIKEWIDRCLKQSLD